MTKKSEFLDLELLDQKVANQVVKNKEIKKEDGAASPATKLVGHGRGGSNEIFNRTMQRRDDVRDLENKLTSLQEEMSKQMDTISLKMPLSGVDVQFKKMWLDPSQIDVSQQNQRIQSLLDMSSVSDIYESIKSEGQSEPGYVRYSINTGRYELVAGSRRLFCVKNIPNRKYLALVGDIPDADIRRLSRLENQQSPISVYERALSFLHDIESKQVKNWETLAVLEGLSPRQIKKYKALADLPIEIVRSFASPADLSLEFADWIIAKIRKNSIAKSKLLAVSARLISEKQECISNDLQRRTPLEVISEYKSALRIKTATPTIKKPVLYKTKNGAEILKHSINQNGAHKFEFVDLDEKKLQKILKLLMNELEIVA